MMLLILPDIQTDDSLLQAAVNGDQDAVMAIYRKYAQSIYAYVRLRVEDKMAAEDLASQVFVEFIRAIRAGKAPRSSVRGWLFQVTRNLLADHYGALKKLPTTTLDDWAEASVMAPGEDEPEVQFIRRMDRSTARHAIRMLPEDQQEVLVLRFGQMLNLQETADIMGKSINAVKSLQFRAVQTLRGILRDPNKHDAD